MTAIEELELETLPAATREVALPELEFNDDGTLASTSTSSQQATAATIENDGDATQQQQQQQVPRIISVPTTTSDNEAECLLFQMLQYLYTERELDAEFW